MFVELDFLGIALVAPTALETGLYGERARIEEYLATNVQLHRPFLVLRVRELGQLDVVEFVPGRIGECPYVASNRIYRHTWVGIVEADDHAVTVEISLELDRVE